MTWYTRHLPKATRVRDSGSFRYTRSHDYQTPTRHALLGSGRCWKTNLWIGWSHCWLLFSNGSWPQEMVSASSWFKESYALCPRSPVVEEERTRPDHRLVFWGHCGKERKTEEEYLYSAFSHQGTYKVLSRGSQFTCKQHHACLSFVAFTRCHHRSNWGSRHPIAVHYSFIDPERMKGWVGLVGRPIADGLPT